MQLGDIFKTAPTVSLYGQTVVVPPPSLETLGKIEDWYASTHEGEKKHWSDLIFAIMTLPAMEVAQLLFLVLAPANPALTMQDVAQLVNPGTLRVLVEAVGQAIQKAMPEVPANGKKTEALTFGVPSGAGSSEAPSP